MLLPKYNFLVRTPTIIAARYAATVTQASENTKKMKRFKVYRWVIIFKLLIKKIIKTTEKLLKGSRSKKPKALFTGILGRSQRVNNT